MKTSLSSLLVASALACTINGRPIAFAGPSGGAAPAATPAAAASAPAPAAGGACRPQMWADPWPTLTAPADPWLAVKHGQPVSVSLPTDRTGKATHATAVCDAARDHCFRDCTWLVTDGPSGRIAEAHHFADGVFREASRFHDDEPPNGYVAYRTVPVTRKNLKPDMLVMAVANQPDAGGHNVGGSRNDLEPFYYHWDVGIVESIEWDRGLVRLEGKPKPYHLSATRLAVLRYTAGGKVEAIPGVEAKAPALADVILPGRKAAAAAPASQVTNKQPTVVDDKVPMSDLDADCSGKHDHCLRPWVWFVDVDTTPVPARWTGKQFVYAEDARRVIDKPGMAYRTRPATEAELVPGKKILVPAGPTRFGSEEAAHFREGWMFATVEKVDRYEHRVQVKGASFKHATDSARVLVLWWLPGEDVSPVE